MQLISAGQDETIPYQTVKNFIDVAKPASLEHHVLSRATHVIYENAAMRLESFRLLRDWLLRV